MKVLSVGIHKTGTTTLKACFEHFGFRHRGHDADAFHLYRQGAIDELLERMERGDTFGDWPWNLLYREAAQAFPDAKFVLTRRINSATWFRSLCAHAERTGPTQFREAVYGHAMPHGHDDAHIRVYESHTRAVREWFAETPDRLLDVCWEEGDGWGVLAPFLGRETPTVDFPHEYKRRATAG